MPRYDKKQIEAIAKEQGFTRDAYEKVIRLIDILRFVSEDKDLSKTLALKGGTAINLTMFALPRLSVDLDFDFSENLSRNLMLEKREVIVSVLSRYMSAQGYSQSPKSKTSHSLDSFVYSYSTSGGSSDNIKIEINYSLRSHVLPICEKYITIPISGPRFNILTLSPIEVYAGKTVAFLNRGAARDLFDLYNMISKDLFTSDDLVLFRKCTAFYSAIAGRHPITDNEKLTFPVITSQMIKTDLNPMLRTSEYFNADVANTFVSEWLIDCLIFTDSELLFGQEFSKGLFEPELLFNDLEVLDRIKNHPMAIWRTKDIVNLRQAANNEI